MRVELNGQYRGRQVLSGSVSENNRRMKLMGRKVRYQNIFRVRTNACSRSRRVSSWLVPMVEGGEHSLRTYRAVNPRERKEGRN